MTARSGLAARSRVSARLAVAAAGLLLAAAPLLLRLAPARADSPTIGGFKITSSASGFALVYNDGSEAAATLPDAQTDFATGAGHALAADFYPGPVGGNPGSTIEQFLGADLPPQVIQPLSTLRDNAKAEAYSSGPNDSTFPSGQPPQAVYDHAHADAAGAEATGSIVNGGQTTSATSRTVIGSQSVTTTATSSASDLSIGGVIHIARVTSTATATSTVTSSGSATVAKVSGKTVISGMTVGGQAVSIGPSGLTVGPASVPVDATSVVNAALRSAGISMSVSPYDHSTHGGAGSVHAPALSIFFNPPNNGGNTFTVTLGGASAQVNASPAYLAPPLPASAPAASSAVNAGAPAVATPFTGGAPAAASEPVTGDAQSAFAPPAAVASSGTSVPGRITGIAAVVDFTGVKAGLVVLGLVLAGAAAFGMGKIPDDVLAEKASASSCPLERSAP